MSSFPGPTPDAPASGEAADYRKRWQLLSTGIIPLDCNIQQSLKLKSIIHRDLFPLFHVIINNHVSTGVLCLKHNNH